MKRTTLAGLAALYLALVVAPAQADWRDWLNAVTGSEETAQIASTLSESEIADGLKAALGQGVQNAVNRLGREGGFLADQALRIPVPEHLRAVESALRQVGQGEIADQFVGSLNHAAEQAVPAAAEVFSRAVSEMTIDDARQILDGSDTAATEYLRRSSGDELKQRFVPLVDDAVGEVGVTRNYQQLLDKAGPVAAFIDRDKLDLRNYVADEALDGLFTVIGEEEQKIRANPAARTTDLLKRVFGS